MAKRKVLWPIFSFIILLSIFFTIISFLVSKTDYVKLQVEQIFRNIFESNFNVKVEIGETEGNILTGYTFNDIKLFSDDSLIIGKADYIAVEFNIFSLLRKQKTIERILIKGPSFDFTKKQPQMLLKKKEEVPEKKTKNGQTESFGFKNISIINGDISLLYRNKIHTVKDLNIEGTVYLSSTKKRITLTKCVAKHPYITDIKSFSGTVTFKDDFISFYNCSLITKNASFFINGNLFDEHKRLTVNMNNVSLDALSRIFLSTDEIIRGRVNANLYLVGKSENLEAEGTVSVSNIIFNNDSLGGISCDFSFKNKRLAVKDAQWNTHHGEVSLSGYYNLTDKSFGFETNVHEFVLDNLTSQLIKKDWKGRLTGEIIAKGNNITDRDKREFDVKANLRKSIIKNLSIDSLNADISYKNKAINLKEMEIYSLQSYMNIKGVWGVKRKIHVTSNNFYLPPLFELLGINDIKGNLTMDGYYEEQKGKRIIQARIDCNIPGFKNIDAKNLTAQINFNVPGKNSQIMIKDVNFLNTHLDSFNISVISDTIIRGFSLLTMGKEIHLYSTVNISKENEIFVFMVDTLSLRFKNAEIKTKEKLQIELEKDMIRLKDGLLYITDIPIEVSLDLDKSLDYSISLRSDSFDLRTIAELLNFNKDLGGTLKFDISGHGSLRNPRLALNLSMKNFFLEEMRAEEIQGVINYFNDELHIDTLKILKGKEISEVNGIIPLTIFRKDKDANRKIKFTITANDLGSWIFYPYDKYCHFEGGKVYGSIKGEGTVGKIDMKGDLRIYATNLYIPFLGIRIKDTEGYVQLAGEEIIVQSIKGIVEEGNIELKGKINLHGIKPESIDLMITGNHIPITGFKDLYLTVTPHMKLIGPFSKLSILGKLNIEKGDITIPFRRKQEKGIRKGNLSYDLEISAEEGNIWLKNEDADVELKGKIFAKGTGNVPQLSGFFETKRGFIYYLDQTFTIEKGVFRFTNSPELNPEIDLRAQTKVRHQARDTTVIVFLNVGGTMQKPEFSLTSSDPSLSKENIILLLSFNVTSLEDITSLSNISNLSDKAASYWIRQTLLREFQTTLKIDAIDLETKLLGAHKTAKLTVGKYISKDLYLGVTHDIFASSKDEFEIEYKIWKGSYIIGQREENGRYNLGIRFKFKY